VIGSFMGIPPEDDAVWASLMNSTLGAGDPDLNPDGVQGAVEKDVPEIFERCRKLIAERRENPTDDLTSVLVHAEVDGEELEEHEIVMGFFLLVAAGNDSTKATYCSGMQALLEDPGQKQLLLDDPRLIPSAVEESLRMFPAFAHFRRTATEDAELAGRPIKKGEKVVMWYVSSNRDEARYEDPTASTCAATPSTRPSAPAAGTSASGPRSRGWSCRSCSRRRSRATRRWSLRGRRRSSSRPSSTS
jgi:cholest-4-en-3-one 26-monooxygenase